MGYGEDTFVNLWIICIKKVKFSIFTYMHTLCTILKDFCAFCKTSTKKKFPNLKILPKGYLTSSFTNNDSSDFKFSLSRSSSKYFWRLLRALLFERAFFHFFACFFFIARSVINTRKRVLSLSISGTC